MNWAWPLDSASLARGQDSVLLLTRLVVGSFLLWGVWDNIVSTARMAEFAHFLEGQGFVAPTLMARLSVYAQFLVGLSFIAGVLTRWAGLICAFNFVVALTMVDAKTGLRGAFPATALILIGLLLATFGGGRLAIDSVMRRSRHKYNATHQKGWRE